MHLNSFELIFALLLVFLLLMALARRIRLPYPVVLVVGGLLLSLVPGLPAVELEPELVILVFLPPLLFSEAFATSWRDFKFNLRPIALLSVGLVLATTASVAMVAHLLLPALPWSVCFVLGAVLAPTDAVSALAIAQRLPGPRRIITVLMGESLVNDAATLVAFRIAVVATLTGTFSWSTATVTFISVCLGGVALGFVVAWLVMGLRRLLGRDSLLDNTLLLLAPFIAFLPAEHLHVSGVLAVVVCGLYLGRRSARSGSSQTRMQARGVWDMVVFLLNGLLFVLVGLQLRTILQEPHFHSPLVLLGYGAVIALVVMVTRMLWVFPATYLPRLLSRRLRARDPMPPASHVLVLGWTGMRGGISLAAALAIPTTLAAGVPFPGREEVIFLTFMVILFTLVFQGLTLPLMIRLLGLEQDDIHEREEAQARVQAAEAALARLEELAAEGSVPEDVYTTLHRMYHERTQRLCARHGLMPDQELEARAEVVSRVRREVLAAERRAIVDLRDRNVIGDDVLSHLQHELDLEDLQLEDIHRLQSH